MIYRTTHVVIVALLACLLIDTSTSAQNSAADPHAMVSGQMALDIRFAELSERLAVLESQTLTSSGVQQASFAAPSQNIGCGTACVGDRLCLPHWYSEAELTLLTPSLGWYELTLDDDSAAVAPRITVGHEDATGNGFRVKFWWFDHEAEVFEVIPTVDLNHLSIDGLRYDLDSYHRFCINHNSLLVGAGVSGGGIAYRFDNSYEVVENGIGLSFFAEGRFVGYQSERVDWALVTRGRWGYYVSEWEDNSGSVLDSGDGTLNVAEVGCAVEGRRKFENGDLFLRFGTEAQHWDTQRYGGINFYGTTVALGANW